VVKAHPHRSGPSSRAHQGQLLLGPLRPDRPAQGPNKAAVAVAHSMLETAWHLLSTGALYQDPGADNFERRHDPATEAKRLQRRIEALGFAVTIEEKAA
jgi:hypothetical protein